MSNAPLTLQQALTRLQRLCSTSEKCISDIRIKLTAWQINTSDATKIIQCLQEDKYIDEERYAEAFVRDKSRFSHWGILKIQAGLKAKGISTEIIAKALQQLNTLPYEQDLYDMLKKKVKIIKATNNTERKAKLIRFALSRGFEYDLVYTYVSKLISSNSYE